MQATPLKLVRITDPENLPRLEFDERQLHIWFADRNVRLGCITEPLGRAGNYVDGFGNVLRADLLAAEFRRGDGSPMEFELPTP